MATVVVFFALAVASDWLTLRYHAARDRGDVGGVVLHSVALESLTWAPVLAAIGAGGGAKAWSIAGACVVGSAVGAALGQRRANRERPAQP